MSKGNFLNKRNSSFEKKIIAKKSQKSGQMLVAVMMMITTVIIMFGMTVSVGHLVQSKINLQNSIDLSAMTAASFQARHMNTLSIANYRIRSLYKFFLLDAYVTQSRFGAGFRSQIPAAFSEEPIQNPVTTLIVCEVKEGFHPTVEGEEGGTESGDPCQHAGTNFKITPVIPSFFPGIDPAYIAINIALMKIAEEFKNACGQWRNSNGAWVFWALKRVKSNTDEAMKVFEDQTKEFAADLGNGGPLLIGPGGGATQNTFSSNLLGSTYNSRNSLSLLFLNEASERSLKFQDDFIKIEKRIGLPYIKSVWSNGCSIIPNEEGAQSSAFLAPGINPIVTGMARKPSSEEKVVQVALLATITNANILFWPKSIEPTLVAVAAAKPFGSRIGPPKKYLDAESPQPTSFKPGYGNVTLFPGDNAEGITTGGMGRKNFLGYAFRNGLPAPGSAVNELRPTGAGDEAHLQQIAFSPTIFDSLYFSIFDISNEDSHFFSPDERFESKKVTEPMRDRGALMPDPYNWLSDLPKTERMEKYFNKDAVTSGWSPDPDSPSAEKRSGYQIKLLSIESACKNSENNPKKEPTLMKLCETNQATL